MASEQFLEDENEGDASRPAFQVHRIISISIYTNFGEEREFFFYRKDMSLSSLEQLMESFYRTMVRLRDEMRKILPDSIAKGLFKYLDLHDNPNFKTSSVDEKTKIQRKIKFLRDLTSFKLYSWNGEKYDTQVLLAPLMELVSKDQFVFGKTKVIKRAGGYMEIRIDDIVLRLVIS